MVNIRDVYIKIFREIRDDPQMIELLEIDQASMDRNSFLKQLKTQIIDTANPGDMLNDYSTKICIRESSGSYRTGVEDIGFVALDIHTTQDKDAVSRNHLKILQRLIEILDSSERRKQNKEPLDVGLEGLIYTQRPSTTFVSTGWEKHTILFRYKYLTNFY